MNMSGLVKRLLSRTFQMIFNLSLIVNTILDHVVRKAYIICYNVNKYKPNIFQVENKPKLAISGLIVSNITIRNQITINKT